MDVTPKLRSTITLIKFFAYLKINKYTVYRLQRVSRTRKRLNTAFVPKYVTVCITLNLISSQCMESSSFLGITPALAIRLSVVLPLVIIA